MLILFLRHIALCILYTFTLNSPVQAIDFVGKSHSASTTFREQVQEREIARRGLRVDHSSLISLDTQSSRHNYAQEYAGSAPTDILQCTTQYLDDDFVIFAKTLPGYDVRIEQYHTDLLMMNWPEKLWAIATGQYTPGLSDRIEQLYNEVIQQKQERYCQAVARHKEAAARRERERAEQYQRQRDLERRDLAGLCYQSWQDPQADTTVAHRERIAGRLQEACQVAAGNSAIVEREYELSETARAFAQLHLIGIDQLIHAAGTVLDHVLHGELVEITQQAAHDAHPLFQPAIGQMVGLALLSNHPEYVARLADFCWTLLDYSQAVGEGVYLGVVRTGQMFLHPLDTVHGMAHALAYVTLACADLVSIPIELSLLYALDRDGYHERLHEVAFQAALLHQRISEQLSQMSTRDMIKEGSAFITQGLLTHQAFSLAANTAGRIATVAAELAEAIPPTPAYAFAGEGFAIAQGSAAAISLAEQAAVGRAQVLFAEGFGSGGGAGACPVVSQLLACLDNIDPNKIHHILAPKTGKHAWHKVCADPKDWESIKQLMRETIASGRDSFYGTEPSKVLEFAGEVIEVTYRLIDEVGVKLSNAWVKTK